MQWHQFLQPNDPELDRLAQQYNLHPLHMEDVRSVGERTKVEDAPHYTFALLKTILIPADGAEPVIEKICIFASRAPNEDPDSFFLVVADTGKHEAACALRRAESERDTASPSRLLYVTFDSLVDSYFPVVDSLDDEIDALEARVVSAESDLLNDIFAIKRQLMDIRRVLVNTRDASMHLQRDPTLPATSENALYLRDLYDHISRLLDMVETQRDLLNNALDIYLSSIANRTNEVMKVLTILSTIALPALVVTGVYGMNIKDLPMENSPHGLYFVATVTILLTSVLLWLLRRLRWI